MAKHEIEDVGGRARLVSISRSSSRFAIVVSPYFQPNMAVVYSLHLARSPRRPRTAMEHGVNVQFGHEEGSSCRNHEKWRRLALDTREEKDSEAKVQQIWLDIAEDRNASKLTGVASMPQLPALVETKDKKAEKTSVADWREMWKQRALQELLGS
eukprot:g1904.t1